MLILASWPARSSDRAAQLGFGAALVLALFAGLRADSTDYQEYVVLYDLMQDADDVAWPFRLLIGKDPLFGGLMLVLVQWGAHVQWLFLTAATLSMGLKWRAFQTCFGQSALPLLVCLSTYYFLHDLTQIRAGIAIALCMVALVSMARGQQSHALMLMVIACGFHLSAAMLIPLSMAAARPGRQGHWLVTLLTLTYIAGAHAALALLADFDERASAQLDLTGTSLVPLLLNGSRLAVLIWLTRRTLPAWPEVAPLLQMCLRLSCAGLALQIGFRDISSALAFRSFELLDAFSVFILAAALLRGGKLTATVAVGMCLMALTLAIHGELLPDYAVGSF